MITAANLGASKPADIVLSADGAKIFASYADGYIRVYDAATGLMTAQWDVGLNLGGIDLSPDGTFLMVTERTPLATNGLPAHERIIDIATYKVDVATGAAQTFTVVATGYDYVFFDVEVLADGTALLTQSVSGSAWINLKLVDTATGQYTTTAHSVRQSSILTGSDDGSLVLLAEANISSAPIRIFETGTGFVATRESDSGFNSGVQAFSDEAGLVARHLYGSGVFVYNEALQQQVNLSTLHGLRWVHGAPRDLAFNASGTALYILDGSTDTIVQLSTRDWSIVQEVPTGVDLSSAGFTFEGSYGNHLMADPNGAYFVFITDTGLRIVPNPFAPLTIDGTSGDDILVGNGGDDTINGYGGNDDLSGNGGDDEIDGGEGNDFITVESGVHVLDGGSGDDTLRLISAGPDPLGFFVDLEAGELKPWEIGTVSQALGFENVSSGQGLDEVIGTAGANILAGEEDQDVLLGGAGNDLLLGDGNIRFVGGQIVVTETGIGSWGDVLHGEDGDDRIVGGAGEDFMTGGAGNDILEGGADDDSLRGDFGNDVIDGGAGVDRASYAHSIAAIGGVTVSLEIQGVPIDVGAFGMDTLISIENLSGSRFSDHLTGDGGSNYISGGASVFSNGAYIANNDMLFGLGGDDLLAASIGTQSLDGGAGIDTATIVDTTGYIPDTGVVYAAITLSLALQGGAQASGFGNWTLTGIENLSGWLGDDQLTGDGQANVLAGAAGNDLLTGGGGNDTLLGDGLIASLSGGTITTSESVSYAFGDAPGTYAAGNDILDGGEGDDRMVGGRDDDIYHVDSLGDVVVEQSGEGTDEIRTSLGSKAAPDYALFVIPDFVENLTGTSAGAQGVRGNALNNVIVMGLGADLIVLDDGGIDNVNGGGGNDFIFYGAALTGADTTNGGAGTDTVGLLGNYAGGNAITFTAANLIGVERLALYTGGGTNSYSVTMNDANVPAGGDFFVTAASLTSTETLFFNGFAEASGRFTVLGGSGADTIVGGKGNDYLAGNAGADILYALAGNDFIIGGLGADQLTGGGGFDAFRYFSTAESTTGSVDQISDFTDLDRIDLSGIDANSNAGDGDTAFTFIGTGVFTNVAGQLRATGSGSAWTVEGDVNGDGIADLIIQVTITDPSLPALGATDFIL